MSSAPATEAGQCVECSTPAMVRRWELHLARRGVSHRDVRESLESGEPPPGFRRVGTAQLQLCERCERRLLWQRFRDLATHRKLRWRGVLLVLAMSVALGHFFGRVGFMLGPVAVAALGTAWFLHGWLRRDPQVIQALLLARHRQKLAAHYRVDPQRLLLAPPSTDA